MISFVNHYSLIILGLLLIGAISYFYIRKKSGYSLIILFSVISILVLSYFVLNPEYQESRVSNFTDRTVDVIEKPKFVQFFSSTCLACLVSNPIVEGFEQDFGEELDFIYLNVADNEIRDLIVDLEIRSVPTFIIFDKKGEVFFRSSGIPKSDVFISKLQEVSLLDTN